jgi:hypothetical protein
MMVKVGQIDHLFVSNQIDFLKTDTEGNELAVLRGGQRVIKESRRIKLIIEINPAAMEESGSSIEELWDYIHSLGDWRFYLVNDYNETMSPCCTLKEVELACNNPNLGINLFCLKGN